jgi:hypothetical protein
VGAPAKVIRIGLGNCSTERIEAAQRREAIRIARFAGVSDAALLHHRLMVIPATLSAGSPARPKMQRHPDRRLMSLILCDLFAPPAEPWPVFYEMFVTTGTQRPNRVYNRLLSFDRG